jgi:hypothetical protein
VKKRVDPSFVAIGQGQPGAGKGKALLAVDSKLVPATANRTTISGDAATRAGALESLEDNIYDAPKRTLQIHRFWDCEEFIIKDHWVKGDESVVLNEVEMLK